MILDPIDQSVRDKGFNFVPFDRYLASPFQSSTNQTDQVSAGIPEIYRTQNMRGDDNFGPFNPDMSRIRQDYRPYDYNQAMRDPDNPGVAPNPDLYYPKNDLSGLANFIPIIGPIKRGVEFAKGAFDPSLFINQRSIMENEGRGMGIFTDDIGRIVQGPGDYDTGANVMAGYNLSQLTPESIEKRRATIKKAMSKPGYSGNLQERLDALDDFEEMYFGPTGLRTKTDAIKRMKMRKALEKRGVEREEAAFQAELDRKQRGQRQRDLSTIEEANRAFRAGDDSAYASGAAGIQKDSKGNEVGYNDPFDPGGGEKDGGFIDGTNRRMYYMDGGLADLVDIYD
jgi:hypothetical protein